MRIAIFTAALCTAPAHKRRPRPSPSAAVFITLIVKAPVIQIFTMLSGLFMIALEFPLPKLKAFAIHRSLVLRIVLLLLQVFLAILFYQVGDDLGSRPLTCAYGMVLGHQRSHMVPDSRRLLRSSSSPRRENGGGQGE